MTRKEILEYLKSNEFNKDVLIERLKYSESKISEKIPRKRKPRDLRFKDRRIIKSKVCPYIGVNFLSTKKTITSRWQARISKNKITKKYIFIGAFETANLAAEAYNKKAIEVFGENAILNNIEWDNPKLNERNENERKIYLRGYQRLKKPYIPLEEEVFMDIEKSTCKVSNIGTVVDENFIRLHVRENITGLQKHKQKGCFVELNINNKRSLHAVHKLMMMAFRKDERLPIQEKGTFKNFKLNGAPTKKQIIKATYIIRYTKKIEAINGNYLDLRLDNFKWKHESLLKLSKYNGNRKRANVFYTGDVLIRQIKKYTTAESLEDNKVVIEFLEGNENAIWSLFIKYKKNYIFTLKKLLRKYKNHNRKAKEDALELHDIIIEAQMQMTKKIKKGYYCGLGFPQWSSGFIKIYLLKYFDIRKTKKVNDGKNTGFN